MLIQVLLFSFVFMSENFESGQIPNNWSIYDHGITGSSWTIGSGWDVPIQPPSYGSYYVYLDGPSIDSLAADTLVSPSVDISQEHTSLYFTYGMSFIGDANSSDTGIVIIRFYSGGSWSAWTTLATYGGDIYQETDTFDINAMAGSADSLQVGFVYWAGDSCAGYFAVDNVEIYGDIVVSNDVEVTSILSPDGYIGTTPQAVEVAVVNNSSSTLTSVPLTVIITDTVSGNVVYNQSTTFDIAASETLVVTLSDFQAASDTQFFNVVAYTSLSGDPTPSNDTAYAFAYSYPILGTILERWPIQSSDDNWYGTDYHDGAVYILNFSTGEVMSFNPETETFNNLTTLPGTDSLFFWDLAFDKETGNWWVTAFKKGGLADSASYVFKFDSNWNLVASKRVAIEVNYPGDHRVGVPSSIDDKPYTSDILYSASFKTFEPIRFMENNFDNLDTIIFIDSTYVGELVGVPATLGRISDTLFLVQASGDKKLNLVSTDWNGNHSVVMQERTDSMPTGGDVAFDYYPDPNDWIVAYMTFNGNEICKVSLGIKWAAVGITESNNKGEEKLSYILMSNGIIPAETYSILKDTPISIYSVDGRAVFRGKLLSRKLEIEKGVFVLLTKDNRAIKIINR